MYPDKFSKSVLLINLLEKYPFHNATKRTEFLAKYVFLKKLNGYSLKNENQKVVEFVVRVATYQVEFDSLENSTTVMRKNNSTKIDPKE